MKLEKIIGFIGKFLLITLFAAYLMVAVGWILGFNIINFVLPVVFSIFSFALFYYRIKFSISKNESYVIVVSSISLISCSLFAASLWWDCIGDGPWYHQPIIYSLMQGWNPDYEMAPFSDTSNYLWINHYAKGAETSSAIMTSFTNNIELGKASGLLFVVILWCFLFEFLSSYLKNTKKHIIICLSILFTACPVVICQIMTFYIDFYLYIFFTICLINLYNIEMRNEKSSYLWIGIILALSISFKFNFAFWISLILLIYAATLIIRKQWDKLRKGVLVGIIGGITGLCILGFNPYISNIRDGHHLLYPLVGDGNVDIIDHQTPKALKGMNRIEAVFASLSCRPTLNESYAHPYTFSRFTRNNLRAAGYYDIRVGGFGFFYFEILLISFFLICVAKYKDKKVYYSFVGIELLLFSFLFILPAGWWARYVGFFYLFPCIALMYVFKYGSRIKIAPRILLVLLIINIANTSYTAVSYTLKKSNRMKVFVKELKKAEPVRIKASYFGFKHKLDEYNINTTPCDTASFKLIFDGDIRVVEKDMQWSDLCKNYILNP